MNDGSLIADALTEIGRRMAAHDSCANNVKFWEERYNDTVKQLDEKRQQWMKADKELFSTQQELELLKKQVDTNYISRINVLSGQLTLANENRSSLQRDLAKAIQQRDELDQNLKGMTEAWHEATINYEKLKNKKKHAKRKKI